MVTTFANGDIARVRFSEIKQLPPEYQRFRWNEIRLSENKYQVLIPKAVGFEDGLRYLFIPSINIRKETDKEFLKNIRKIEEFRELMSEEVFKKRIGHTMRRLREEQRFNVNEITERAGITEKILTEIENGNFDIENDYYLINKILEAMYSTYNDLTYLI